MKKRLMRRTRTQKPDAAYPTTEEFEGDRREFLTRFGATILGAGTLAATLAGCGDRSPVGGKKSTPDAGQIAGGAPMPDARADTEPPKEDIYNGPSGVAPTPDARVDMPLLGDADHPDAKIDKKDMDTSPGFAPPPDAKIDQKKPAKSDFGLSGGAPMPDAAGDKKKQP